MATKSAKERTKCPECKSVRIWRKGYVPSRGGPKARAVCYDCGATFYVEKPKAKRARAKKAG